MREVRKPPLTNVLHLTQKPPKMLKHEDEPITFMDENTRRIHFPRNDPLVVVVVVVVQIVNMKVHKTLIDNESSVDILYLNALRMMGLDVKNLHSTTTSLYGFIGDSVKPLQTIQLPLTVG